MVCSPVSTPACTCSYGSSPVAISCLCRVALPVAHSFVLPLRNARAEAPQFERLAAQLHINTIASGSPQEHIMKFYFYAQAVC